MLVNFIKKKGEMQSLNRSINYKIKESCFQSLLPEIILLRCLNTLTWHLFHSCSFVFLSWICSLVAYFLMFFLSLTCISVEELAILVDCPCWSSVTLLVRNCSMWGSATYRLEFKEFSLCCSWLDESGWDIKWTFIGAYAGRQWRRWGEIFLSKLMSPQGKRVDRGWYGWKE